MTRGLCLDAGALIGIERGDRRVLRLLEVASAAGYLVDVPVGVIAQTWRGGSRQARLARFLRLDDVRFADLDRLTAQAIGELCAVTGSDDVVVTHVALHARRVGLAVVTSDPDDFAVFEGELEVIAL